MLLIRLNSPLHADCHSQVVCAFGAKFHKNAPVGPHTSTFMPDAAIGGEVRAVIILGASCSEQADVGSGEAVIWSVRGWRRWIVFVDHRFQRQCSSGSG
jgi:hypothetical protein